MEPLFFRIGAHSVSLLLVHMVWSTREREPRLAPNTDAWLAAELERIARGIGCHLVAVGNAADHVHALIAYAPSLAVANIAQSLKGASSRSLGLREGTSQPWQNGYWAESVGKGELEPLVRYVRHQRAHHDGPAPREPWEDALRSR
jgi:REP element-mobilizing transposase RayT